MITSIIGLMWEGFRWVCTQKDRGTIRNRQRNLMQYDGNLLELDKLPLFSKSNGRRKACGFHISHLPRVMSLEMGFWKFREFLSIPFVDTLYKLDWGESNQLTEEGDDHCFKMNRIAAKRRFLCSMSQSIFSNILVDHHYHDYCSSYHDHTYY